MRFSLNDTCIGKSLKPVWKQARPENWDSSKVLREKKNLSKWKLIGRKRRKKIPKSSNSKSTKSTKICNLMRLDHTKTPNKCHISVLKFSMISRDLEIRSKYLVRSAWKYSSAQPRSPPRFPQLGPWSHSVNTSLKQKVIRMHYWNNYPGPGSIVLGGKNLHAYRTYTS